MHHIGVMFHILLRLFNQKRDLNGQNISASKIFGTKRDFGTIACRIFVCQYITTALISIEMSNVYKYTILKAPHAAYLATRANREVFQRSIFVSSSLLPAKLSHHFPEIFEILSSSLSEMSMPDDFQKEVVIRLKPNSSQYCRAFPRRISRNYRLYYLLVNGGRVPAEVYIEFCRLRFYLLKIGLHTFDIPTYSCITCAQEYFSNKTYWKAL